MIKPTIGRQVWYFTGVETAGAQPQAATICYVWGDRMVNLQVIDFNGHARGVTSVTLLQDDDYKPSHPHCEWMPYQKATA